MVIKTLIVILLAALIATAADGATSTVKTELCMDDEQREQVRDLMIQGFNEAMKDHTKHLFDVWVRDVTDQPDRAITGMNNGVSAYLRARASALKWSPPNCK
jgi:hypothetical protein